jgi:hypothetical protein
MLNKDPEISDGDAVRVKGAFETIGEERYYVIRNVDRMDPFFMSIISNVDHWLFISSTGGLTAGRVSPETALFPYITVDRIHESFLSTGSKTLIRVETDSGINHWEPFNREHDARYSVTRNLYKNLLGDKLRFEEINHDLQLAFRYLWATSDEFGFVRHCEIENLGSRSVRAEVVDGLLNLLPAGTPRASQTEASNLVNAYKWNELCEDTGLGIFSLYSCISDRAEPRESLRANTVFCLGLDDKQVLLSARQLEDFRDGKELQQESLVRGTRGAYLVEFTIHLAPGGTRDWSLVADIEQSQCDIVALRSRLRNSADDVALAVTRSVDAGSDDVARIMAAADGFQDAAEENVTTHHYANVLFNVLRGGIFNDQYAVSLQDFANSVRHFNRDVYERNEALLRNLPAELDFPSLLDAIADCGDPQLERLCYEYLPITFGRRHGDPSRPWNHFSIKLKDDEGNRRLFYEGNWRDIFQNWEALAYSYPEFIENVIAKFVNASTIDGYNPYRITKDGIDWEVEDPEDPWSYIGYWGDHQIIYLLKLLEMSRQFHPTRLRSLLRKPIFSYANVPYRIKPFDALLEDPKSTVVYDDDLAVRIEERVERIGADGKLVMSIDGNVYQANLLEKLLVPLLAKLSNLVVDGGIWLNTQRPEWNDANNALVGNGLSMVTLYYMRRYVRFVSELLEPESGSIGLSKEIGLWLTETAAALARIRPLLGDGLLPAGQRYAALQALGEAASRYRQAVYLIETLSGPTQESVDVIKGMLDDALAVIDHSIGTNEREDGLFHAYNILHRDEVGISVDALYPMLEGQVAALSSGALSPQKAGAIVEALYESAIYREDQHTFMLYPDRELPRFLEKNRIPADAVEGIPLLKQMLEDGDERIAALDVDGHFRFNPDFTNASELSARLDAMAEEFPERLAEARQPLLALYEDVFHHRAFTGRSGGMFGFEGLGSIYWHMVAKLLLAVQENYFLAIDRGAEEEVLGRLGELYYRIRAGIGFNKSPQEYGAFPTDPYSHTPKHAGARQPGMTGQVKEEVLTRFGELGVRIDDGAVRFQLSLLRRREFETDRRCFEYLDIEGNWQELTLPAMSIAFTWCQVPIVYLLDDSQDASLRILMESGEQETLSTLELPAALSRELFRRSGRVRQLIVTLPSTLLLSDPMN